MKKIIGYMIRLTAILLSVIFFTMTGVDAAIAVNDKEISIELPFRRPDPCVICVPCDTKFGQSFKLEVSKLKNGEETPEEFITALNNLLSKYLQKQSTSNTETEQSPSIQ
ncbi:MAG: hypothetical protein AAF915_28445 [Cyanobacteria bacterium P01_D01_bin.50]